ncbi:iron-siderophore ABC transporter substrate-binding protein [Patulibacter defluvii]|uniref:iron-siderophore ABC transporter substrate-binding protein n=1 Tax=Patulibacter defluvii TaxID=3095358 RepID=UPI002A75E6BF|nr:iron-siderophore ABC transporter substrate-binding protein [Patulibacter sp. DM4]
MKRVLLLPLLLLATAVAGCGGDDGGSSSTAAPAAKADSGAFPVTIRHARGEATIPSAPKRVVAVGLRDHDTALALGVKAVGAMDWFQQGTFAKWPWEDWGGAPPQVVSDSSMDINFERLAGLAPDLILGVYQDLDKAAYGKLSRIAPTVAQSGDFKPYTMPWRDETRVIAKALGRSDEAEKRIRAIDARFAEVREQHPEFRGKQAVFVDPEGGKFFAFASTDPRGQFLRELGFSGAPRVDQAAKGSYGTEISPERLDLLDVDYLFLLMDQKHRAKVYGQSLFTRLDVVERGDVIEVPYYDKPQYGAAIAFNSVLSLPYAIDGTLKLIDAAAAKKKSR